MQDDIAPQPYVYKGGDPNRTRSPVDSVTDTVKQTMHRASEAYDSAKKPGMPLSVLANIAREAPLGALFAAFIIGVMVGRR